VGLEAIISRIQADAEAEAERIRADAAEQAEGLRRSGREEANEVYRAVLDAGMRDIRQEQARRHSQALIRARKITREARENIIARCFEEAAEGYATVRKSNGYPGILASLAEEGAAALGAGDLLISVREDDRELAEEIAARMSRAGRTVSVSDESLTASGGVVIMNQQGIRVENTFEARTDRYHKGLLPGIAAILFGKD